MTLARARARALLILPRVRSFRSPEGDESKIDGVPVDELVSLYTGQTVLIKRGKAVATVKGNATIISVCLD